MVFRMRHRLGTQLGGWVAGTNVSGINQNVVKVPSYYPRNEYIEDELHPGYPYIGGPFELLRSKISFPTRSHGKAGIDYWYRGVRQQSFYEGDFWADIPSLPSLPLSRKDEARHYGPIGFAKAAPTKPAVNLFQFASELITTPKSIMKAVLKFDQAKQRGKRYWRQRNNTTHSLNRKTAMTTKRAATGMIDTVRCFGKEYLAVEFGWLPFVSDLDDWYTAHLDMDRRVANLRNNNNKWQRRRCSVHRYSSETTVPLYGTSFIDPNVLPGYIELLSGKSTTKSQTEIWFSGKLKYYIHGLDSPRWGNSNARNIILGKNLTPSAIWEIMPWSWLIDWHNDLGTLINNWTEATLNNLTAKYAYCMLHSTTTTTRDLSFKLKLMTGVSQYKYTTHSVQSQVETESMTRVEASPFGSFDGSSPYTPWQLSILSALGLSRLPRR